VERWKDGKMERWKVGRMEFWDSDYRIQNKVQNGQKRLSICILILQAAGLPLFSPGQRSGCHIRLAQKGRGKMKDGMPIEGAPFTQRGKGKGWG